MSYVVRCRTLYGVVRCTVSYVVRCRTLHGVVSCTMSYVVQCRASEAGSEARRWYGPGEMYVMYMVGDNPTGQRLPPLELGIHFSPTLTHPSNYLSICRNFYGNTGIHMINGGLAAEELGKYEASQFNRAVCFRISWTRRKSGRYKVTEL